MARIAIFISMGSSSLTENQHGLRLEGVFFDCGDCGDFCGESVSKMAVNGSRRINGEIGLKLLEILDKSTR